ncbi:MAG TPA: hypothetical protein VIV06_03220 [Candidatus Limnocylindrales bacterium]
MTLAGNTLYAPPRAGLPDLTPETRAIVARAEARRIALQGDQQLLRLRYEEVMRWVNPPWDPISRRLDPRPEQASAARGGVAKLHVDWIGSVITRWAALKMGAPPIFRCVPPYVSPPVETSDPQETAFLWKQYDIERAIAQNKATQMENVVDEWVEATSLHRTLLWAAWAAEAFGKAVMRTGWDPDAELPTAELLEDPSKIYYAWTRRYGNRRLSWALLVDQMSVDEANARFGLAIPVDDHGVVDIASWTGTIDQGDMDQRPEQSQEQNRWVYAYEYWELVRPERGKVQARYAAIVAGRVVEGPYLYPWRQLPFHIFENEHIPTWSHGKSTAEIAIPINQSYDDLLSRQGEVIEFESGPRYQGLNMDGQDEVDIPDPFHLVPLREGSEIRQIETRVDFFPGQLQAEELRQAKYRATGLTPIAEGMSPNAQTSGRAMTAEWRAVELPLASRLVNMTPEIKGLYACWWDYAELWSPQHKKIANGWRRFKVLWQPLDIRDRTEKALTVIQLLGANLIDPETALEELGYENGDEILARVRSYLVDPIFNPLRYQQYLTLQQLELTIRQMAIQTQQLEAQAGGGGAPSGAGGPMQAGSTADQGIAAAVAGTQGPTGPVTSAMNQPGMSPGGGGVPIDLSILSQTPLVGGIGNRAIVPLTGGRSGPSPTNGRTPR